MTTVTQPKYVVPIGTVTINGRTFDVATHPEFVRFFDSLVSRVGGATGESTGDLALSQFEDAGIEELRAQTYAWRDEAAMRPIPDQQMPVQQIDAVSLLDELYELRKRVRALEQGLYA